MSFRLQASVSALALLAAAQAALAQTPSTTLYGGGDTLSAKVYRDIFNCYSSPAQAIYATSPGNPPNVVYPTALNTYCTAPQNVAEAIANEPVGGVALSAYTTGNPANFGSPSTTNTVAYLNSSVGVNATPYPEIEFAGSAAYLTSTQAAQAAAITGGIFVVPTIASPIDLPIGKIKGANLTTADVCNVFAGATSVTSGGTHLTQVVVRSDSSSQAFVFGDWLSQNCPASLGFNAANGFPSNLPNWSAVFALNGSALPLVTALGSGGEAAAVSATSGAIGFISPDYVYPVVGTSTAFPATVNGISPVVSATTVAKAKDQVFKRLKSITYPATYNPATFGQLVNEALVAPGGSGYPIVAFAFIDTYNCYSVTYDAGRVGTPAKGTALRNVLKYFQDASITPIIGSQGFDPVPPAVKKLLNGSTGPFGKKGIQSASCPKT
jgi:phosphate transport system substrate-binding protein